ncbi:MAG: M14 family metallopeptidase [Urechidicola sp.]|nr:M14 family metallopeptidase [Urechidicola sp.]
MQRTTSLKYFAIFFWSLITFVSCGEVKKVVFKTPVDTTSKKIELQVKQTYQIDDMGVYASNEFDGARLNGFEKLNDSTVIVKITPENSPINNSAYYAFKTWSTTDSITEMYYTFQYPIGYKNRYVPKIKRDNNWSIIDSSRIFLKDSIVTVKLKISKKPIVVAAQEIHSSTDVKNWYSSLVKGKESFISVESFGKSALGKNLPVLNIGIGNPSQKDIIVLLTRQHPPEVTGYFAFKSFMKTLLDESELSKEFLSKYHILAFPIMNPDGVDMGNWRHNSNGVDLNRDWSIYNQPEIKQAVTYIDKELKKNNAKLILGLDFHSTWHDIFYTNEIRENTALPNFIDDWFTALEENIPNYKVNEASSNSTKPVSKGWMLYGHGAVGITYEIGDATPQKEIDLIGKVTAEQMMKILLK